MPSCRKTGMAILRIPEDLLRNTLNLSTFACADVAGVHDRLGGGCAFAGRIPVMPGCDFSMPERARSPCTAAIPRCGSD